MHADRGERSYSFALKTIGALALLALFLAGGVASFVPSPLEERLPASTPSPSPSPSPSPAHAPAQTELPSSSQTDPKAEPPALNPLFEPRVLSSISAADAGAKTKEFFEAARLGGADPQAAFAAALPPPIYILSILALDRDVDAFIEAGLEDSPAGERYRLASELAPLLKPLRPSYEAVFAAAFAEIKGEKGAASAGGGASLGELILPAGAGRAAGSRAPPYIAASRSLLLPSTRKLANTHPYALDIFFRSIQRKGVVEIGPPILSLGEGLVVAASGDWLGGSGANAWIEGGLSPSAGNGVVVYEPAAHRYCSYFHLSSISVRPGLIVAAGQELGRGGNSGANARSAGHGEHLHFEIFNIARGSSLKAREILDLLKN